MEDFTELMNAVKAYDWGRNGAPLLAINAEIRKVLRHPAQMARLEEALLAVLQSGAPEAVKRAVSQRLSLVAGDRSVPVLAGMLADARTSDMARYALERIPSNAVAAGLRDAMTKSQGTSRIGIIHSIGYRRDSRAVPALGKLLNDSDAPTAQAAAWALGRIGGAEAISLLKSRKDLANGRVRTEVLDAYLVCARRLVSEGKKADAVTIYRELNAEGMPAPVRRAATLGLKSAEA
jgi:HEAT repeat protein